MGNTAMRARKWWLLASLFILAIIVIVIYEMEDIAEVEKNRDTRYFPPVTVVNPHPHDNKGVIRTYAEVKPRWSTMLKAQVSGSIKQVFDRAFAGEEVGKGDVLIRIEDSRYQADLRDAEQVLAEAKLNLLQEQNKSSQNKKNWQRSGINKLPSELVLNIPQLEVAKKTLVAAKSRVDAARKMLEKTRIRAPFSGVITERHISVGQTVVEGDELLRIIQNDQQEITVALGNKQWNMLAEDWKNQVVSIRDMENIEIGRARIKRGGGFVDPETRQYKLFLELIDGPDNRSLVGEFVQVNLPSRIARNSLAIPESALTRGGFIWYLDDDYRLRRFVAKVLFYRDKQIVIDTPPAKILGKHHPSQWRIATTPLASFLAGRRVEPVTAGGE